MNSEININGTIYVKKSVKKSDVAITPNTDGLVFVICRGYYCGVHAGWLKETSADGRKCKLVNSRRLWRWTAKKGVSLSAVATHGIRDTDLPETLPTITLTDVYEIIPCTDAARATIEDAPILEQKK